MRRSPSGPYLGLTLPISTVTITSAALSSRRRITDSSCYLRPAGPGETIGEAFRASVNATLGPYRWLNIQGDPTLRLHTVKPPANVTAEPREDSIHLKWQSGENGCVYNVYRAASPEGPFERVNDTPLKDLHFEVQDDPKKRTYMVRALKGKRTGRGSYWNISQGTTATLK